MCRTLAPTFQVLKAANDGTTSVDGRCRPLPPSLLQTRLNQDIRETVKPELRAAPSPDQMLSSWKDIANYLRRDVRTVQRWETTRGLPVHRLPGTGRNAIYALRSEIDAWWASSPARSEPAVVVALQAKPRPRAALIVALILLPVLAGYLVWLFMHRSQPRGPLAVTPLTSLPGAELYPSLSPDGTRVAFTWKPENSDNYDIYVISLPAGKPERLTTETTLDWFAEWSPDGEKLAYLRFPAGSSRCELRLLEAGLRQDRLLYSGPLAAIEPPSWAIAWSRDGRALVVPVPLGAGPRIGLSRIDIATGSSTPLTKPEAPAVEDRLPTLSPDGRSLLFVRKPLAGAGNVYRLNLDAQGLPAGPPRQITDEPCCVDSPSWTRDGREIVFTSSRTGSLQMMRVSAQGGKAEVEPSVAAPGNGSRIASNGWLIYSNAESTGAIVSVDLSGGRAVGKPRPLIASSRRDRSPAYSPDGRLILFSSDRGGTRQLWVCARDGASPRQLTKLDGPSPGISTWSPSGKWIAFEAQTAHGTRIYVADASTGQSCPLALEGKRNRRPYWSHDGKSIYYASDQSGRYEIWRVEIDGDATPIRAEQITRNGGFGAVESADGRFLYYSRDFTFSALCRVPVRGGSEEEVLSSFPFNRYPLNLAAGAFGLYFRGQGEVNGAPVWFLPYSSRTPRRVMMEIAPPSPSGITLSPEDRQLLLPVFAHVSGDVLAVQSFR